MVNIEGLFDEEQDIYTVSKCLSWDDTDCLLVARRQIITLQWRNQTTTCCASEDVIFITQEIFQPGNIIQPEFNNEEAANSNWGTRHQIMGPSSSNSSASWMTKTGWGIVSYYRRLKRQECSMWSWIRQWLGGMWRGFCVGHYWNHGWIWNMDHRLKHRINAKFPECDHVPWLCEKIFSFSVNTPWSIRGKGTYCKPPTPNGTKIYTSRYIDESNKANVANVKTLVINQMW